MAMRLPTLGVQPPHPADVIASITHRDLANARVMFVNMPLRETALPNVTPEGPLLMATRLRNQYGVHATVLDLNAYRLTEATRAGLSNGRHLTHAEAEALMARHITCHGRPHLVAFSGMITTLRWQEAMATAVRRLVPETFLVSGNGLATELKTGLFRYIPELNAIADSEGDDVIIKITFDAVRVARDGWESAVASGILRPYYMGYDGKQHRLHYQGNRPRNLDAAGIADLEILREDVDGHPVLENYLTAAVWGASANNSSAAPFTMERSTTAVSSRGCPFECDFCFRGSQGERNWGIRSAEHLARQVKQHVDLYNIDFFGMPDDNFAVNPKRIADMIPFFQDLRIRWGTHTRLDEAADLRPDPRNPQGTIVADPRRIDLMAQAGCIYIGFGAESASPAVLTAMRKGGHILANGLESVVVDGHTWQFPRTMMEGIRACEDAGIHSNCTWIMAYPTETLEHLKTSVAFMRWQEDFYASRGKGPNTVNKRMFTATWYPGTEMVNHPKVHGTLTDVFGITFDPFSGEPMCDEFLHNYILELDDATKLLHDPRTGDPLNYSEMPMSTFEKVRDLVDAGRTLEILDM
jgi:radical SAM superfamily enzyme YgiQ (UPF0313 family)